MKAVNASVFLLLCGCSTDQPSTRPTCENLSERYRACMEECNKEMFPEYASCFGQISIKENPFW